MTSKFVTVSESIPLHRNTVEGLIDTIKEVFSEKKPVRFVYTKNEPLVVDRRIRQELAASQGLVSAYQMVRQHSDIDIQASSGEPLRDLALASQKLASEGYKLVCLVSNNKFEAYSWFDTTIRPDKMLNLDLIEDPECPENCLFIAGSKSGTNIKDIEASVLCRMEK